MVCVVSTGVGTVAAAIIMVADIPTAASNVVIFVVKFILITLSAGCF